MDGKPIPIFKNPKDGGFKKSQKGLCYVTRGEDGMLTFTDGYTKDTLPKEGNLLQTVFVDGKLVKEQSLAEIRQLLNQGRF